MWNLKGDLQILQGERGSAIVQSKEGSQVFERERGCGQNPKAGETGRDGGRGSLQDGWGGEGEGERCPGEDSSSTHAGIIIEESGESAEDGNANVQRGYLPQAQRGEHDGLESKAGIIAREFAHHEPGMARLNNGSFGSCPQSVLAAQAAWVQVWLQQPDAFYFKGLEEGLLAARTEIAHLIHAPSVQEVVLVENATTGAAMVALDVMWAFVEGRYNKGDSILLLDCTYGAVKKAFKGYASRAGAHLLEVKMPFPVFSAEQILHSFEGALKRERAENPSRAIRLAVIDHITSMPSIVQPIPELVRLCRKYGVEQIFVDGAHAIGNVDINVQEIDADYYMSNVHKWLFAPSTVAFFHCKPQHLSRLHHPNVSQNYGTGLVTECDWVGTRDYCALLAVPAAIKFIKDLAGSIEAYSEYNHKKVVAMGEMLATAWGTHLGAPQELCAAMVMVGLPPSLNVHSQDDALKMRVRLRHEFQVEVPLFYAGKPSLVFERDSLSGDHQGRQTEVIVYARISHQIYNRMEDYCVLRDAVNSLSGISPSTP